MSPNPQSVSELFRNYLLRQTQSHAQGMGLAECEGEVTPHDSAPIQPVEPRVAWDNALAVVPFFSRQSTSAAWETPPDWPVLVAGQEPVASPAFCLGNYPQLVRSLRPLLHAKQLRPLLSSASPSAAMPAALHRWTKEVTGFPQRLLAAAALRLSRRFDEAIELLGESNRVPAAWRAFHANEEAALSWHRGHAEEALALWQAQSGTVPVLFNRGMAALFLGKIPAAQSTLLEAIAQLPETSAWHHLGQLYLTLAAAPH